MRAAFRPAYYWLPWRREQRARARLAETSFKMADDLDALLDEVENKFCRLSRRDCSERLRASQSRKRDRFLEKEEEAEAEAAAAGERARFTKILTKGASEEEDIDEIIKDIDESTYIRNFTKQTPRLFNSASENNNTSIQTHDVAQYTLVEAPHHMVLEQIFHRELVISYVALRATSVFCITMTFSGTNHVITSFLGIICLNSAS